MKFATSAVVLLLVVASGSVSAETVFSTIDQPFRGGFFPDAPDQKMAQQFLLGDNETVTSASITMHREGSPTGTIHLEIWDDSGSGTPGEPLGLLGSIDIPDISASESGGILAVDSPVSGLTPNETYYLVMSFEGISFDGANHAAWGGAERTAERAAANGGVEEGMLTTLGTGDWVTYQEYGGGPPFLVYNLASVEAVPEPSAAVLSLIGCLSMLAWRRKRANRPRSA
ncbi:MAG: PEP-CTERM sorting domain-containing protein [Planctomycetes bacterium]|nr:PEP-CTERM sorting domain-containing protein [Planctomycetota bacterium]